VSYDGDAISESEWAGAEREAMTCVETKTPWNPSRRATARVSDPLPAPKICPFCGGEVVIVRNGTFYGGRDYGEWPWAYVCSGCEARVGMHPFTNIPLGTLADIATREARKAAHVSFDGSWRGRCGRREAYEWLAGKLEIPVERCHIGMMDTETCQRVVTICRENWMPRPRTAVKTKGKWK
jgi:hypothetical protein